MTRSRLLTVEHHTVDTIARRGQVLDVEGDRVTVQAVDGTHGLGRGRHVRDLASIIGTAALGEDDRRYLGFADDFEQRFIGQGAPRRGLTQTRSRPGAARPLPPPRAQANPRALPRPLPPRCRRGVSQPARSV